MPEHESRRLVIRGHVQGVGFRHAMTQQAAQMGVGGWVCNRSDGTVEALVTGSPDQIAALLNWARHGPPGARVDHVAVEWAEPGAAGAGSFTQR